MNQKIISENRKAKHEYYLEDGFEAGILLKGTEVKSIRNRKVSINEAYVNIKNNECYIYNMNISPYKEGNIQNTDEKRIRKLLLNKKEILKLINKTKDNGYTIIPTKIYLKNDKLIKIYIQIARGKKLYDKRGSLKEKEMKQKIRNTVRIY